MLYTIILYTFYLLFTFYDIIYYNSLLLPCDYIILCIQHNVPTVYSAAYHLKRVINTYIKYTRRCNNPHVETTQKKWKCIPCEIQFGPPPRGILGGPRGDRRCYKRIISVENFDRKPRMWRACITLMARSAIFDDRTIMFWCSYP